MGEYSLDEFTSSLAEHGFTLGPRGRNVYKSLQNPDRSFVIRQRVVRLERKNPEKRSHRWRLDSSYLISSQLHLAGEALDTLDSGETAVQERKVIVSLHWLISSIAAGLALSGWAVRNLFLFITASEPAYRPKGDMILIVSAFVVGISLLALGLKWWRDFEKFRRNSMTSSAQVLGRQLDFTGDFERSYFSYRYFLRIGFVPTGMEKASERIELRARVKAKIYRKHLTGSSITVQ